MLWVLNGVVDGWGGEEAAVLGGVGLGCHEGDGGVGVPVLIELAVLLVLKQE